MKKFNILVSPLESTTCLATIHFDLTNPVYIAFLLAQKRIQSWSQGIQKNGKYKVTTTVTNEEIQHFSVHPGIHHLPSHYSFLFDKSSVYILSFGQKRIQSWSQGIQENGKYKVTTIVTNKEIQHLSVPPGIHHFPSYYSFLFNKSSAYSLSYGSQANSILVTRVLEKREI